MNADWLKQLAPEHAPAAVSWWPPAPGWWVLGVLVVVTAAALWWWLRQPERAPRRAALRQLKIIKASDADGAAVARATQNLIRRYALAVFGRERVARLTGERWLQFVIDGGGDALAGAPGRSLLAAAFGNHDQDEREQWIAGAEAFIRRARNNPRRNRAARVSEDASKSAPERRRGAATAAPAPRTLSGVDASASGRPDVSSPSGAAK
jgi:hypothetical protein